MKRTSIAAAGALCLSSLACTEPAKDLDGIASFKVTVSKVNGADPPGVKSPLEANIGLTDDVWEFSLEAVDLYGAAVDYDGFARVRVEPGAVNTVEGKGAVGRNVLVTDGKASGKALVTAVYGPSRLWIEDVGYTPVDPAKPPSCADGIDDDGDERIDYPADPGCEFADDDSEEGGSFAAGVSAPVYYALPRIADIQGEGTKTPYPFEGIQAATEDPQRVIVTRVSSDGFYVTDVNGPPGRSNSLFAFNFSTPAGMRVCDRLTYLAGTVNEFFGFSEMSFPSYDVSFVKAGQGDCEVPSPAVLDAKIIKDPVKMEALESALVRVEGFHIAENFGPALALKNSFKPGQSNCDLNGDGQIDFTNTAESGCSDACSANPECSEWTGFSARGNYKISDGGSCGSGHCIQINTSSVADFDPPSFSGETITSITGTMRNFSGGTLNWTIETRCTDDLVCSFTDACQKKVLSSKEACVRLRTTDDPDEGTN